MSEHVLCGIHNDVCLRSRPYKLRAFDSRPPDGILDRQEFYDLEADPDGTVDRIDDPALSAEVRAHQAFLAANFPPG